MGIADKVALVTGASTGIGAATAERLVAAGYKVYGTSRRGAQAGQRSFEMLPLDVTNDESVEAAVSEVMQREGRIDLLVNNAGFSVAPAGAEESSIEQARAIFDTNFFGIVRMTRAVVPHMRRQGGGRIINIGSVFGLFPAPYMALYAATKHAVEGYSESLDHELRTRGVRVSVIEPANTKTQFHANLLEPDAKLDEYREARAAMGKKLTEMIEDADEPAVVADAVLKAAVASHPKLRYAAGWRAWRLRLLRTFAPAGLVRWHSKEPATRRDRSHCKITTCAALILEHREGNMKALVFKRYGGPAQVAFADIPRPVPKPDEILVMVHAAGLNPIDNMISKGTFKPILRFQLPATLGSDFAGVVVEVGSRVTRFKPGDAVFASVFDLGTGALAEFALVPENAAALKPANLNFVQAASIPMVGLTSWQALKERMHLKPGQKVFIPAGAGGIGTFAIQLAKYFGAKVGTTTSTGNVEMVQSLGADEVIDYTKQEFEEVLRDYDAVLGTVRGDSLEKSLRILKPESIAVSLVGPPDTAFGRARGMNFFMVFVLWLLSWRMKRRAKKRGVEYSFLFVHPDGSQLAEIGELLKEGSIRPVIDKVFPFDQAKEALAYLDKGRAKGKVVVQMK